MKMIVRTVFLLAGVFCLSGCELSKYGQDNCPSNVKQLEKIRSIDHFFLDGSLYYFGTLTSLCVDQRGHVFVADSGKHRIYEFDEQFRLINQFGALGQGPGEFLGTLRCSLANNNQLYITDDGNRRLTVYSHEENCLLGEYTVDVPVPNLGVADSSGRVFMISSNKSWLVDIYSPQMELLGSVLQKNQYLRFAYYYPPKKILGAMLRRPNIYQIKLLCSDNDRLYVILNSNQSIVILNKENVIIKKFKVKHPRFIEDYQKRLKAAVMEENAWVYPFGSAFFDDEGNLCLCSYNSSFQCPEIYRYGEDGKFKDILVFRENNEPTNQLISDCDRKGNFYSIDTSRTRIAIYRMYK